MFTWRHFLWLFICFIICLVTVFVYRKRRPSLNSVLTSAVVVCIASELIKVFSMIEFVPSANGEMILPYLSLNHLPLHFCSIQILIICYLRFSRDQSRRESILAFLYPTCAGGAVGALLMPSIFTTSTPVEQAFTNPMPYQFFLYHTMLVTLGVIIVMSGEVKWQLRHLRNTLFAVYLLGFASIYLNSMFASPTYVDGKLKSVDFWSNFFFTYQNPLGIKLTEIWQWYVYLAVLGVAATVIISILYLPLLIRENKKHKKSTENNY